MEEKANHFLPGFRNISQGHSLCTLTLQENYPYILQRWQCCQKQNTFSTHFKSFLQIVVIICRKHIYFLQGSLLSLHNYTLFTAKEKIRLLTV